MRWSYRITLKARSPIGLCEAIIRVSARGRGSGARRSKTRDFSKYSGADGCGVPNLPELSLGHGPSIARNRGSADRLPQTQLSEHDFRYLVVTMSEKGICLLGRDGYARPLAGACARSLRRLGRGRHGLVATHGRPGLRWGAAMESAVEPANIAAGIVVGKVGTSPHCPPRNSSAQLTPSFRH